MTLGNSAGALVVSVLLLLGQASDKTPTSPRPTDEPTTPVEPPGPSGSAPPAKPSVSHESGTPPGRTATGRLAQRESVPQQASQPPKASAPPAESEPRPETAPAAETAPRRETTTRPETAPPIEAPPPTAPPAAPLDLGSLEKRLRETEAIGAFTKLSLKNQVDDLLADFREYHKSHDRSMLTRLRQAYDLLLMKVLSLLQDNDPALARDIASSREALWRILTDPDKFKNL